MILSKFLISNTHDKYRLEKTYYGTGPLRIYYITRKHKKNVSDFK